MNGYIRAILRKQFDIGGHGDQFKGINFKEYGWYSKFEWTSEQQNIFKNWLIAELLKRPAIRKCLMAFPNKNMRSVTAVANEWIFQYGFKTKDL